MIAIDTNVVVRLLTRDDADQYAKAYKLFKKQDVFIGDTVILETEWVLRFAYDYTPTEIAQAFSGLFGLVNVHISQPTVVAQAIDWHQQGMDFADALHLASSQQVKKFYTFDKKFQASAKRITGREVLSP
ncbi:type II toxin-antitoxin system VapC family toxin [Methylomonas sp. YC3]